MAGWLLGTADGEEVERLLLDGCWPCGDSDREVWRDCGGDGVARQCREVCDQAVEAVDRQAVVGLFGGLFVECCWGPLGFGDNAGAQGLSGDPCRCPQTASVPVAGAYAGLSRSLLKLA